MNQSSKINSLRLFYLANCNVRFSCFEVNLKILIYGLFHLCDDISRQINQRYKPIARISREKKSRAIIFGRPCNWKRKWLPRIKNWRQNFLSNHNRWKYLLETLTLRGPCHVERLSNVEIGVEFWNVYLLFCVLLDWKKDELLCNFCNKITQPLLDLEGAPKCISQQH